MLRMLRYAKKVIEEQRENPDPRFLENGKQRMRGLVRWLCDIERDASKPVPISSSSEPAEWSIDDLVKTLSRALDVIQELRTSASDKHVRNAKQRVQGTVQWARDVERHVETRRTMPRTN